MNLPEKRIESVHLQLTRKCNLRCHFCGQWGQKGFFNGKHGDDMGFEEWKTVVDSLVTYREISGISPSVILWGGEPLTYPKFKETVEYLKKNQFQLQLITNGVLIDKFPELIRNCFQTVYVSIDGPKEIHDSIRGEGVFDRVTANVKLLKGGNAKIVFMTTVSRENVSIMAKIPRILGALGPDKIILQKLIFLTSEECSEYAIWLKSSFCMEAASVMAWTKDDAKDYLDKYEKNSQELMLEIQSKHFPINVEYLQHGDAVASKFCLAPFRRLHVAYNGDVLYCTDFYDFKAGNVRNSSFTDIFSNGLSEKFRVEVVEGNCPTCNHCSWKNKDNYNSMET